MSDQPPIQPHPTPDTEEFWAHLATGRLGLCWCETCTRYVHPPLSECPTCAQPTAVRNVSGNGTVHSFIVTRRAVLPGYPSGSVVVLVDLDDQPGLRLAAQLTGLEPDDVRVGMPVRAVVRPLPGGEFNVPVFERR
jgi:uncharacterized OB-fold protein